VRPRSDQQGNLGQGRPEIPLQFGVRAPADDNNAVFVGLFDSEKMN